VLIFAGDAFVILAKSDSGYKYPGSGMSVAQAFGRAPLIIMSDIEGFILAGGASSRMGTDKARLTLGTRTFVERIAAALHSIATRISIVSAKPESIALNLPVVADVYHNCGALAGIHAALQACRAPWAAIVSCDLPFVSGELFARLAALRTADFEVVAPRQVDDRPQPLCALYARETNLGRAEKLLLSGERRPRILLQEARTRWVAAAQLADLKDADLFFLNVNTPEDYENARRAAFHP
jgi:molybdopterin-guanine dinucleotide biosynthesis protein A